MCLIYFKYMRMKYSFYCRPLTLIWALFSHWPTRTSPAGKHRNTSRENPWVIIVRQQYLAAISVADLMNRCARVSWLPSNPRDAKIGDNLLTIKTWWNEGTEVGEGRLSRRCCIRHFLPVFSKYNKIYLTVIYVFQCFRQCGFHKESLSGSGALLHYCCSGRRASGSCWNSSPAVFHEITCLILPHLSIHQSSYLFFLRIWTTHMLAATSFHFLTPLTNYTHKKIITFKIGLKMLSSTWRRNKNIT